MSAPDELRRQLDERGAEWRETAFGETIWLSTVLDGRVSARRVNDKLVLFTGYKLITPEQAIAATLGTGTCHMELRHDACTSAYQDAYECSKCGEWVLRETFMGESEPPRFCPNCGAKVVSE